MGKSEKDVPELVRAALALDAELSKLEAISRTVRKIRLNSEKNIARAAKELNEALVLPERMGEGLQSLAAAMAQMQVRQQAALEPMAAFAAQIQQRMQRLTEHMQAFAALGQTAAEVTALIQAGQSDHSLVLAEVETQLSKLSDGARALFDAAQADDFPDLAREADALKQRTGSLRKRLLAGIN